VVHIRCKLNSGRSLARLPSSIIPPRYPIQWRAKSLVRWIRQQSQRRTIRLNYVLVDKRTSTIATGDRGMCLDVDELTISTYADVAAGE